MGCQGDAGRSDARGLEPPRDTTSWVFSGSSRFLGSAQLRCSLSCVPSMAVTVLMKNALSSGE
ncbi:hypothetical protein Q664_33950 [Archangium violaceum Cb vi76]|uniref:Uncharacterized protein n=1 Tax=Archangium violaceum Cb vi76 TaxID=1406225 RepID=A0A084SM81_9BACT|nr:hypothetical protein Q664_33950 [Archangium violaceum Cb vi76]